MSRGFVVQWCRIQVNSVTLWMAVAWHPLRSPDPAGPRYLAVIPP